MSLIAHQVLPSFCCYSTLAEVPSTKKVWKCRWENSSLLSQHHAHCCQFLWTAQSSRREKAKPSKLLFLHLVILTPFWGFPTGWQTFATSDVGNTAHCSSWARTSRILLHLKEADFKAYPSPRDALPWLLSRKTVFAVWPKLNFLFRLTLRVTANYLGLLFRRSNPVEGKMRKSVTMKEWPALLDCFFLWQREMLSKRIDHLDTLQSIKNGQWKLIISFVSLIPNFSD